MTEILIEFDRATGEVRTQAFRGDNARQQALAARIASERAHANYSDMEIVVLSAESEDDIGQTHARYFHSAGELASQFKYA